MLDPDNIKYDLLHESLRTSQAILDYPIFAEIIEEMMLSRYHLASDDDRLSEDARSFLSCTLSGSMERLMNVRWSIHRNADATANVNSTVSSILLCLQEG